VRWLLLRGRQITPELAAEPSCLETVSTKFCLFFDKEKIMPHIALPADLPGIRGAMAFRPETARPLNALLKSCSLAPARSAAVSAS